MISVKIGIRTELLKNKLYANCTSENTVKFLIRDLAKLTRIFCNSQHEALMNMVLSFYESYWSEIISHNFLIWYTFLNYKEKEWNFFIYYPRWFKIVLSSCSFECIYHCMYIVICHTSLNHWKSLYWMEKKNSIQYSFANNSGNCVSFSGRYKLYSQITAVGKFVTNY